MCSEDNSLLERYILLAPVGCTLGIVQICLSALFKASSNLSFHEVSECPQQENCEFAGHSCNWKSCTTTGGYSCWASSMYTLLYTEFCMHVSAQSHAEFCHMMHYVIFSEVSVVPCFFRLLAKTKIGMQYCKRSCDLNPRIESKSSIGGFKLWSFAVFAFQFWPEQATWKHSTNRELGFHYL